MKIKQYIELRYFVKYITNITKINGEIPLITYKLYKFLSFINLINNPILVCWITVQKKDLQKPFRRLFVLF